MADELCSHLGAIETVKGPKHAHASGHPVIASAEPGARWLHVYPDETTAQD